MSAATPVQRGCGSRKEGGVYLECGVGLFGEPIESFMFDPPVGAPMLPAEWLLPHRTPQLFERDGVHHLVIWVGSEFYPNVFDFIEETRVAGASRRVPTTFDFSKLSAASRMYFVHGHALVDGEPIRAELIAGAADRLPGIDATGCACPTGVHSIAATLDQAEQQSAELEAVSLHCLGLAKRLKTKDVHGFETRDAAGMRTRTLPCGHSYQLGEERELESRPGMFLQLPLTAVTCVTKADGSFDAAVEERVRTARVDIIKADR